MNHEEFADLIDQCRVLFTYVNRLAESEDAPARLSAWRIALCEVEKSAAEEYVAAMVRGDVPTPEYPSQWDAFPGNLRKWCKERAGPRYFKAKRVNQPDRRALLREQLREGGFGHIADDLDRTDPI